MASSYEVTATRKRPQDFDRLVGQDFVVSTLENAIKENRIAHAYLFSGPRGVGKTSSARLLAKALNCEKGPTPHPCGECDSCRAIAQGKAVDVIEIDGASNTSVNDIRAIKEEVMYPPQTSKYKIYIIDEVHMLSTSAFNALLKTIEEPPEYIIFIFATTELQKVPATIRSRCQQFRFNLIGQDLITKCLKSAAEDLDIEADEDALFWIAKESTGSMRDAYTLFDQVAAFSGKHITLQKIREKLSIAGFGAISDIREYQMAGLRSRMAYMEKEPFFIQGTVYENLRLGNEEVSEEQIEAALKAFLNLYRDVRYSLSPRFEIELMILRLASLPSLISPESLVKKLEDMKQGIAEGNIVVTAPKKTVTVTSQTIAEEEKKTDPAPMMREEKKEESEPEDEEMAAEENFSLSLKDLPSIQEALRKMGKSIAARYITSIEKIEENDGIFTFTTSKALAYNSLKNDEKSIISAVASAFGENPVIKLRLEEKENGDSGFSSQMKELKAFFGGNLIKTKDDDTKEIEEQHATESKPIRTDENYGLDPEPDEDN